MIRAAGLGFELENRKQGQLIWSFYLENLTVSVFMTNKIDWPFLSSD